MTIPWDLARSMGGCREMALATLVLIGATSPARAEETSASSAANAGPSTQEPGASASSESSQVYRETITAAVAEFAAGHHAEARALFRRAHAMRPNARTLRGIGMCAFELREYAEAVRALTASIADTRRPLTDEQLVQVRSALERANAFVGRFEVDAPDGALLFVDGAAAPTELEADGTLLLTLGTHVVAARRDDTHLGDVRVEVRGGEREPLVIVRRRETVTPQILEGTPARTPDLVPGIVLIASGGALLLGGAIVLGIGLSDAATVEGARAGTAWSSLEGAYGRAPTLQGVGAASLGVGVALAAIGGILLGLEGATGSTARRDDVVQIDVGVGALALRGSF